MDFKIAIAIVIAVIFAAIALVLVPATVVVTFPIMTTYFVNMSTLTGFTWSTFFASGGIMYLVVSTALFLLILAIPLALVGLAIYYVHSHMSKGGR